MRSRVLFGVGAWVLGAVSATAGSLYAVDLLGQGLLEQHTKQVSVAMVNAELARDSSAAPSPSRSLPTSAPGRSPSGSPSPVRPAAHPSTRPAAHRTSPPATGVSRLLTSPGGTAEARCGTGGAYLVYWSPAQGFEADDVSRGPATVASVKFNGASWGVLLRVTCSSGVPVKHVSTWSWGGGTRQDG